MTDHWTATDARSYRAGRQAARNGQPRSSCPWAESQLRSRCWWMAGHADQQRENYRCTTRIRDDHGGSALSLTPSVHSSPWPRSTPRAQA